MTHDQHLPHPDIAWVAAGDVVMIQVLSDLSSMPVMLEATAVDVWRLLADGYTPVEIVTNLADAYGVGEDLVAPDVFAFLDHARAIGIVMRSEDGR